MKLIGLSRQGWKNAFCKEVNLQGKQGEYHKTVVHLARRQFSKKKVEKLNPLDLRLKLMDYERFFFSRFTS